MLKYCSEELLLPFNNFEDIVLGLAVTYLGEAVTHNEGLYEILCEYINTMPNKSVGKVVFDEDCEYHSDMSLGEFNTQKRKRRRVSIKKTKLWICPCQWYIVCFWEW